MMKSILPTNSNRTQSYSFVLLICLSMLFLLLFLSQYMAHITDQAYHQQIKGIFEQEIGVKYRLKYPKYRHFSLAIVDEHDQRISLPKDIFDFYFDPSMQRETDGNMLVKKIDQERITIVKYAKPLYPKPNFYVIAWMYFLIFAIYLGLKKSPLLQHKIIKEVVFIVSSLGLMSYGVYASLIQCSHHGFNTELELVLVLPLLPLLLLSYFEYQDGNRISRDRVAFYYVFPAVFSVFILVFIPFFYGIALSFTQKQGQDIIWVGVKHYQHILVAGISELKLALGFYFTFAVTFIWTISNLFFHVAIGLTLALILNQNNLRFKGIYRVLLILPWAVPSYITALVWKGMFHQQYGLINAILDFFAIQPIAWMGGFWQAFASNLITNTWLGFPFMMVICLGALQSIPKDLYEAARLDGASPKQQLFHITLPLLTPTLVPAVLLSSVWTFNMFNVIYLVSAGKPGGKTDILITQAYRIAFEQDQHGYAAAYSMLIFLILLLYSLYSQKWTRYAEELY